MTRREGQRSGQMPGHCGQNNGVCRDEQGGEMMMMREGTTVVGEAAIGMLISLCRPNAHRSG